MKDVSEFTLDEASSPEERSLTHVLSRSLIEGFFWIAFIYDDRSQISTRWESFKNGFKREYLKLLNEPQLPHLSALEPADPSWASLPNPMDVKSMLAQLRNAHGDRLDFLYSIYRISSFDTHGRNLAAVLEDVFSKPVKFPVLKIGSAIELISNHYLVVLDELRKRGDI